ncbi:MAG TPA: hypothetical protein VEL47_04105 [Myxococcota bacterium]|nr:hypothetical protein [Myxococcota bacterium]
MISGFAFATIIIVLLCGGCGLDNKPSLPTPKTEQPSETTTTRSAQYSDTEPLPSPSKTGFDEITTTKINDIKASSRFDYKLCIGCPNDEAHRKRFGDDLKNWVFLDVSGFKMGQPFLHMDLANIEALKLIAEDGPLSLKGRFSEIAFDFSVARLSPDFKGRQLKLVGELLAPSGKLYMWPDERPFEDEPDVNLIDKIKTQPNYCENELRKAIKLLDLRYANLEKGNAAGFDPQNLVTMTLNQFDRPYKYMLQHAQINSPQCNALLSEYEAKKLKQLQLVFKGIGLAIELKHGDYPIPGDGPYLKDVDYFAIRKIP